MKITTTLGKGVDIQQFCTLCSSQSYYSNSYPKHPWLLDESGEVSSYPQIKETEQKMKPLQNKVTTFVTLRNQSQSSKTHPKVPK